MNTRYHCPYCQHKDRTFVRYIDVETGEHLPDHVGKCERRDSCGIHFKAKQFFEENKIILQKSNKAFQKTGVSCYKKTVKPTSYIPEIIFNNSLKAYDSNEFIKFLVNKFGVEQTSKLISRYYIGSSKHWTGATVFWQVDIYGKIRTGKIMLYDDINGKRVKKPFNHITWVHKVIGLVEFELLQCFFGEHLLKDFSKPVAIVESEKTAIIASAYLPQFIWLAAGSISNLSNSKCQILKGRAVTLFPDLNGFDAWRKKASEFSQIGLFQVSDLLERKATQGERVLGLDLADYLLKFEPKDFNINPITA